MKHIKNLRIAALLLVLCLALFAVGCGSTAGNSADSTPAAETVAEDADSSDADSPEEESGDDSQADADASGAGPADDVLIRVGSLKGPTTMGLVNLMDKAENGNAAGSYSFIMSAQPTEIVSSIVSGDLDIALIPANLASTLYNRTEGGVIAANINTLGVLYCVTGNADIQSIQDLAGKTVITTGQGSTPEYAIRYLLDAWQVPDVTLEFKSEATEAAAVLSNDPAQIAVLPQPFATVAQVQNEALQQTFSLADTWEALNNGSQLVTGVTVVRRTFAEEHPEAVAAFLQEQSESAAAALEDVEGTAELVARYGIIEKAPIAARALPYCGIACIGADEDMPAILNGYLETLFAQDPTSIGGALPEADFYVLP